MNYAQWYETYMSLYKRRLSDKTRESYARLDQLVNPIIGAKPLEAITPDDIQAALVAAEDQAGSRQAQLVYTLLHAAFRRAVRSGHIRQSPVEAVDKPDHEGKQGRAIEGACGCMRACFIHLEKRKKLLNQFRNPFRTGEVWRVDHSKPYELTQDIIDNYVKTGMIEDYMEQIRYDEEENYKTSKKSGASKAISD